MGRCYSRGEVRECEQRDVVWVQGGQFDPARECWREWICEFDCTWGELRLGLALCALANGQYEVRGDGVGGGHVSAVSGWGRGTGELAYYSFHRHVYG